MTTLNNTINNSKPDPFKELITPSRILIANDNQLNTKNGANLSYMELQRELESRGHEVAMIRPTRTIPNPLYPDLPFPIPDSEAIGKFIKSFAPNFIHIGTEGPIGLTVRGFCIKKGYQFTTAFHTLWPEYFKSYMGIPKIITWTMLRKFHNAGANTMTRSESMVKELETHGFYRVSKWHGSVDVDKFTPLPKKIDNYVRPILLYVGRIAREKNLEQFLDLELGFGTKLLVGDGPMLKYYKAKYPDAVFIGEKSGQELSLIFSEGDVFVFPSKTDTFGRVVVEALASGVPVAALPITGPKDIITSPEIGALSYNLEEAIKLALKNGKRQSCVEHARRFSLKLTTDQFYNNLVNVKH